MFKNLVGRNTPLKMLFPECMKITVFLIAAKQPSRTPFHNLKGNLSSSRFNHHFQNLWENRVEG